MCKENLALNNRQEGICHKYQKIVSPFANKWLISKRIVRVSQQYLKTLKRIQTNELWFVYVPIYVPIRLQALYIYIYIYIVWFSFFV